ncbi:hypothetical protein CAF53_19705 [Sphingobium sp. LB126]|uniref:NAD(P)-dependent oxidoreductase n=1 Tax=Sphingobium sp. LB126 TaxID=1983755 RepID=UPI000C205678|nr:NAD(P)-dependent oxidoreductase [Sphingobium sp. LB126]PJG46406.1 hypothetical protein CAF53_19705 [Sphingobium sp. LB126]
MKSDIYTATRVGVIGVGAMGRPVVDRLHGRGFDVAVHVRRNEIKADLSAQGVTLEPDIASLCKGRDFIIVYVYSEEQTRTLCLEDGLVDAMDRGAILIIHTTVGAKTVQDIGERAQSRGVKVVDAGGAWGPSYTALGEMNLMVGGDPADVAKCMPVFATYAYPIHHIGPLGSGMNMKLINNAVLGVHLQLASEVLRIARDLGMDGHRLLRGLTYCTGGSTAMRFMETAVTEERFWEAGGSFLYKDLKVVEEFAAQQELDLGMIGKMNQPLIERLAEEFSSPHA